MAGKQASFPKGEEPLAVEANCVTRCRTRCAAFCNVGNFVLRNNFQSGCGNLSAQLSQQTTGGLLMALTTQEKITIIQTSQGLEKITLDALPDVHNDNYYFVSYSHRDYKQVYVDMLCLQESSLSIWYDRGLPAGLDWQQLAEEHIAKYNCIGVIFYLSENALQSDAIMTEIKAVRQLKKDFLTIMLPYESNGEKQFLSPLELLEKTQPNLSHDSEKYRLIAETFPSNVIYLTADADSALKVEKILGLKRPPLLKVEDFHGEMVENFPGIEGIVGTNDVTIKKAVIDDGIYFIGACAFSNCSNLQTVVLPNSVDLMQQYAFYNCASLEKIDLSEVRTIQDSAFCGCTSLQEVDLSSLEEINNRTFANCPNLKKVCLCERTRKICTEAFYYCGSLEEVFIPESVFEMEKRAFSGLAPDVVFYCQEKSKPRLWDDEWNADNRNAVVLLGIQPDERAILHEENGCGYQLFPDGTARFNAVSNKDVCSVTIPDVIKIQSDLKYSYNASTKKIQKTPRFAKEYKVLYVKSNAFLGLTKLQKVTLGANVAAQDFFFDECTSLQSVEVDPKNTQLKSCDGVLFSSDGTLLCYPKNKQDKKFCLPQNVQNVSCKNLSNNFLEEIEIPKNIKNVTFARELDFLCKKITVKRGCAMKNTVLFPLGSYVLDLSECSRLDGIFITFLSSVGMRDEIVQKCNAVVHFRIAELILPQKVDEIVLLEPTWWLRSMNMSTSTDMLKISYRGTIAQFQKIKQDTLNGDASLQDIFEVVCKDGVVPKTAK
ncbi:MAG: leucine-rich repeat protein [Candidatus Fimimonas sp.]